MRPVAIYGVVMELRAAKPPAGAEVLFVWVLAGPDQLQGLRASLYEAVTGQAPGAGDRLIEAAEEMVLVASELATNALQHGLMPTQVMLSRVADRRFVLEVSDHDVRTAPAMGALSSESIGGRGLHIARAFSLEVGWYVTQRTKHIWALFDVPVSPVR